MTEDKPKVGDYIQRDWRLFRITKLSKIWITADLLPSRAGEASFPIEIVKRKNHLGNWMTR